jgi:hypothetical protein
MGFDAPGGECAAAETTQLHQGVRCIATALCDRTGQRRPRALASGDAGRPDSAATRVDSPDPGLL